ncbi:NAD(P)-dependent alcohol dehydrogenase [Streptomyces sp. ICN441]|uniref:NAD(P)-dependent alcohol dehydrogenase n=1 Tax=Streptomyces sp. ICN441 TaxID=2558286 RepID=UPI00106AE09E|nr:NAD(P)-dependent alcohol dehydrogenase [Streptomyces sp. ICN441]TFE52980.1 NAD(P)-dependent alcohol dehydrogenase [Streptomyces sp. ICN441]
MKPVTPGAPGTPMRAFVQRAYGAPGDVLRLEEVERPVADDDGVLVRVHAASANPADWHLVRGEPYVARLQLGLRRPSNPVPGCDLAGRVVAVGARVTTVRPGDEVYGSPFGSGLGAFAEYASVPERQLARKPRNLTFEQAAAVPLAAQTALQALRDRGRVEPGQRVLIAGASGGVGTFAVQIAKALGADVTGVCSTRNTDLVRSIGADHVIDYTHEDFTTHGRRYDLVLYLAGTQTPRACRRVLTPKGTLVVISGDAEGRWVGAVGRIARALAMSPFVSQRMVAFTMRPERADLEFLTALVESGRVTPVIGATRTLADVPETIGQLESGHTRGKIVITV